MSLPQNSDPDKNDSSTIDDDQASLSCPARAARLTGSGRSAVAVIGLQGTASVQTLAKYFHPATERPWKKSEIRFGRWGDRREQMSEAESVVITPLDHQAFEIHCHGGPAAVTRILEDLAQSGVRVVDPAQWLTDDQTPLVIGEARQVLSSCRTARTAAVALDQLRGALRDWADAWTDRLGRTEFDAQRLRREVSELLARGTVGIRLRDPFRIVLAGPVNVGKSSLVNAIVGYDRSIALDHQGTTRDVLHAETVIDGLPVQLSDTAGFRVDADAIEQQGMKRARIALQAADLVIRVFDPGRRVVDLGLDLPVDPQRVIDVLNKCDLLTESEPADRSGRLRTAATRGEGIDELIDAIARQLARDFPPPGQPVPVTTRQLEVLTELNAAGDEGVIENLLERLIHGKPGEPAC